MVVAASAAIGINRTNRKDHFIFMGASQRSEAEVGEGIGGACTHAATGAVDLRIRRRQDDDATTVSGRVGVGSGVAGSLAADDQVAGGGDGKAGTVVQGFAELNGVGEISCAGQQDNAAAGAVLGHPATPECVASRPRRTKALKSNSGGASCDVKVL